MKKTFLLTVPLFVFTGFATYSYAEEPSAEKLEQSCTSSNMKDCGDLSKLDLDSEKKVDAQKHAKLACDSGIMRGCNVLGLLAKGNYDRMEAKRLFKKSCDKKNMKGCFNLAILAYEEGNKVEAKSLSKRTCNSKEKLGCEILAALDRACVKAPYLDYKGGLIPFSIVQKLDAHTYAIEIGNELPAILKTKRATFFSTGHPVGIMVKDTIKPIEAEMTNGFTKNVMVYEECGIVPLDKKTWDRVELAYSAAGGFAVRNKLKGE